MVYYIPKNTTDEPVKWAKLKRITALVLTCALIIAGMLYVFRLEADDFQEITEENVEALHRQIQAEQYREIFLHNDRRLVIDNDEAELTAMFKQARYFLAQNPQMSCASPRFEDSWQRVRQRFGMPFVFSGFCSLRTATDAAATEYFIWKNSGGALKLAYYEFTVR